MNEEYKHKGRRKRLVEELVFKGITDELVLEAMGLVPRHLFVEGVFEDKAYTDQALPINNGQTISQPFTVAFQTQLLKLKPRMKVLEIGTGSGYQCAVLCEMGMRVFSVEIDERLYVDARHLLNQLGYKPALKLGDGSQGWKHYQPFERILVTAASPSVPESLKQQLEIGGMMVIPVGNRRSQRMTVVTRTGEDSYEEEVFHRFKFVPLRGKYGFET
ncbi:MAG: protein-L-isoaspartate(D-aspartate) O-methyltransferase [Bacteroidetes bacterium]|nr:protein-L-isoaspartate(D-aspartate) O-methyltransferase [Bacteroidota bacterium]MCB0842035.1 protein-L-isoaspartate(D-aspartate) O-methyltransferase [Bacteroidota bacterium]MCB0853439.1 protein-L-isoaspartate(D-aspartate) O-methyltransferase [Bacteroidota bacterium]